MLQASSGMKMIGVFVIVIMTSVSLFAQTSRPRQQKVKQKTDSLKQDVKKQGNNVINSVKDAVPDSVPSLKKEGKKILQSRPDSIGVSYENGKWNLPKGQRPTTDVLNQKDVAKPVEDAINNVSAPDLKNLGDVKKITDLETIKSQNQTPQIRKTINRADSLQQVVEDAQQKFGDLKGDVTDVQQIMSLKATKKLYDSLGISRIDSIRALASMKEDVSADELAQALKMSFPSRPGFFNGQQSPLDLAKSQGGEDIPTVPDLSAMKLSPESALELPAIRGFQLPTDSLPIVDSLKQLNLASQKLSISEKEITDNVTRTILKEKPSFWDRTYVEGILSYAKDQDVDIIQASPAFGYHFNSSLSIGVGPSLVLKLKEKRVETQLGYRAFLKYEFLLLKQLSYLHLEDLVDPNMVTSEYASSTKHSILGGAGLVVPVTKVLGINVCVLYRVNNSTYADGTLSPWVVRLGLSSIKSKNLKSK
jgi:hypothetical protein